MNNWFLVKVKYTKQHDDGSFKRVSESYLVAAMTFTDAEARIYEELGNIIKGEFLVLSIQRFDVMDLFQYDDSDVWYLVKVSYESQIDDSEKAKKVTQKFLVTASSLKEAYDRTKESLSTLMVDFTIPSGTVSKIVDIFPPSQD